MENTDLESLDPKIQKRVNTFIVILAILAFLNSISGCKTSEKATFEKKGLYTLTKTPSPIHTFTKEKLTGVYCWPDGDIPILGQPGIEVYDDSVLLTDKNAFHLMPDDKMQIIGVSNNLDTVWVRSNPLIKNSITKWVFNEKDNKYYFFVEKNKKGIRRIYYNDFKCYVDEKSLSRYLLFKPRFVNQKSDSKNKNQSSGGINDD